MWMDYCCASPDSAQSGDSLYYLDVSGIFCVLLVCPRDAPLFFSYKNEKTVGRTYSSIDHKCGFTVNVVINGKFFMSFRIHKCLSLHDICTYICLECHICRTSQILDPTMFVEYLVGDGCVPVEPVQYDLFLKLMKGTGSRKI